MQAVGANRGKPRLQEGIRRYLTALPLRGPARKHSSMPYAFELWIAHLALLEQILEAVPAGWRDLSAAELEGILLLRAARERMRREYRACSDCGTPMKGKICPRCGAFRK